LDLLLHDLQSLGESSLVFLGILEFLQVPAQLPQEAIVSEGPEQSGTRIALREGNGRMVLAVLVATFEEVGLDEPEWVRGYLTSVCTSLYSLVVTGMFR
jgi:hypothetical protein